MKLLTSHLERLVELSRLLATAPEDALIVRAVLRTLRTVVSAKRVRVLYSDSQSTWKDWMAGPHAPSAHTLEQFPPRVSTGTVTYFESENESAGFVWTDSTEPSAAQVLSLVAPMVRTSLMLNTALKRGRQNFASERNLVRKELHARDEERIRIARELHDDLGQSMAFLKLILKSVEDKVAAKQKLHAAVLELKLARDSVGTMLEKIRNLSHVMYPRILDALGIVAAIKELAHQSAFHSGIEIVCTSKGTEQRLPEHTSFGIYRCCQEALNNALRHSRATGIQIEISFDSGSVRLTVSDNGKGFDPRSLNALGAKATNSGFWTIRQRVADLSGSFRVSTAPRMGTVVGISIPYEVRKPRWQKRK